jgi:hypothetical protein
MNTVEGINFYNLIKLAGRSGNYTLFVYDVGMNVIYSEKINGEWSDGYIADVFREIRSNANYGFHCITC